MWTSFGQVSVVRVFRSSWVYIYSTSLPVFGSSSGFGSIFGVGIVFFGRVVFKVCEGNSGGALCFRWSYSSFACCYKLYLQQRSVEPIPPSSGSLAPFGCEVSVIWTSGGRLGRLTVRVEQQPAVEVGALAGASNFVHEYEGTRRARQDQRGSGLIRRVSQISRL